MSFLYPAFLFALGTLAIPIIIHLFNFRKYRRVEFTNVRFLKEVIEKKKSVSTLRSLLILASRLLFLFFLVLAFAQPYVPVDRDGNTGTIGVYLDNSYSMDQITQNGRALDIAKKAAYELVRSHENDRRIMLITNGLENESPRSTDPKSTIDKLAQLETSPKYVPFEDVVNRFDKYRSGQDDILFTITDAQRSSFTLPESIDFQCILLPMDMESNDNLSIDSVWFIDPVRKVAQSEALMARVSNHGTTDQSDIPLTLSINDQTLARTNISVPSGGSIDFQLDYSVKSRGIQNAIIEIEDYPVRFDDRLYFHYNVRTEYKVVTIYEHGYVQTIFDNLFSTDSSISNSSMKINQIDYELLDKADFVFLAGVQNLSSGLRKSLIEFSNSGRDLCVLTTSNSNVEEYNALLAALNLPTLIVADTSKWTADKLDHRHPHFLGVFEKEPKDINLPYSKGQYILNPATVGTSLLTYANKNTMLYLVENGVSKSYLLNVGMLEGQSNLSKHALFVPMMLQMIFRTGSNRAIFETIGQERWIDFQYALKPDEVPHLRNKTDSVDIIPEFRKRGTVFSVRMNEPLENEGFYSLESENSTLGVLAFNFSRKESNLASLSKEELEVLAEARPEIELLETNLGSIASAVKQKTQDITYWKECIMLALLFLLVEVLLIKLWR